MSTTATLRPATVDETADYLAGHRDFPGSVETDHGLMVPGSRMIPVEDLAPFDLVRLSFYIPRIGPLPTVAAGRLLTFRASRQYLSSLICNFEVNTRRGVQVRTISIPTGTLVEWVGVKA